MEIGVFVTFVVIIVAITVVLGLIGCTFVSWNPLIVCYDLPCCIISDTCGCCGCALMQAATAVPVTEREMEEGKEVRRGNIRRVGEV